MPKLTHLFSQCCGISGSRPHSLRKLENLGVAFHHTPISDSTLRAKTLGEIWMGGKGLLVFACGGRGDGGGDEGRPTSMEQLFCNYPANHAISTNAAPEPENIIRIIFGDICRRWVRIGTLALRLKPRVVPRCNGNGIYGLQKAILPLSL